MARTTTKTNAHNSTKQVEHHDETDIQSIFLCFSAVFSFRPCFLGASLSSVYYYYYLFIYGFLNIFSRYVEEPPWYGQ